jgi:hypothetical protein
MPKKKKEKVPSEVRSALSKALSAVGELRDLLDENDLLDTETEDGCDLASEALGNVSDYLGDDDAC